MKQKHFDVRIEQCLALAKLSNCPRLKVGALVLDPERNVILMEGYNGGPRGGYEMCGKSSCLRDDLKIESGTRVEIGCVHAEKNLIYNAANNGTKLNGGWMFVTAEVCLDCAKAIHHTGIAKVIVIGGVYKSTAGIEYLKENSIPLEIVEKKS